MDDVAKINPTAAVVLGLLRLGPAPSTRGAGAARDEGAMSGWDLHETARASVAGFWNITRSQIYVELERLAAAGYAAETEATGPRGQRRYAITAAGREAFTAWLGEQARAEARPDQLRSPLVLLVFFGEFVPPALLHRALREHRLVRERRLEQLRAIGAALSDRDERRMPTAVLRRGIALAELHLDWIDEVLGLLDDAPAERREAGRRRG
jgi:DNA-binding PadR family transcriptional regulator